MFNTHPMMIRPSLQIGSFLRLKAMTGDFVGFINTEQDVIESVYSPSSLMAMHTIRWGGYFYGMIITDNAHHKKHHLPKDT